MYFFFFYPVGLDRGVPRRPVLSFWLMGVFTVAFLWLHYLPWLFSYNPWKLVFFPGSGSSYPLVTAIFMHNGVAHLVGNLIYFWVFAPVLESRLGPWRFLIYFLIWGVAGNLAHGFVSVLGLWGQGGLGVLGASGAIAGMMGFSLLRLRGAKIDVAWWVLAPLVGQNRAGRSSIPLVAGVFLWIMWQVIQASVAGFTGSSVSFGAHLGGFSMGLLFGVLLGAVREGKAENHLAQGQRYMRNGEFHAGLAEFTQYMTLHPDCEKGKLELARTLQLLGRGGEAVKFYGEVYDQRFLAGDVPGLLEVYREWLRQSGPLAIKPEILSRVAHYLERQLDDQGALETYRLLYANYPEHPLGQRALVRIIVLAAGKAQNSEVATEYLAQAHMALPAGNWREFLEREFNLPAGIGAGAGAVPDPGLPAG